MRLNSCLAALAIACAPVVASASVLYSDSFDTAASAGNYNVYVTNGTNGSPSSDATFAYDYSALGIPAAPHTTDGSTVGVRLRADNLQSAASSAVVGAVSIATKSISSLPSQYVMSVDVWSNYIGGTSIASSGSNGTTGVTMGIGTAGTGLQYIVTNDGFMVEGFGDNGGGTNSAYRVYPNIQSPRPTPTNSSYYAAGTGSTSASYNDPYYSFLTSHTAPAAQTTLSPSTQGGSTPVGVLGFAWHTMTLAQDGTNVTWAIDGHTIATVPDSAWTAGGSQVSLGNDDTGTGGNSAALNQLLNAQIFDNLTVTSVPEPASLSLLAIGAAGLLGRRRRGR